MSGKLTPDLLAKIKEAVNIVEVIGEHVVLRKSGSNFIGLCPFHSERSGSFYISEPKQLYHCKGCNKGGDLFQFAQEIFGISFREAVEEMAERGRVALPADARGSKDDPEARQRRDAAQEKLALAFKLNRFVAAYYHQSIRHQPATEAYFRKRGVGDELGREFYVGAAPHEWESLAKHLADKQAPLELAAELGLIRPSKNPTIAGGRSSPNSSGYFDLFRNRAMFPILDLRGRVAGFGGRALGDDPPSAREGGGPKYMNSPESVIFHKSKLAFGLFQAQKHIREKDEVIVVEGYFDVLALHAGGFRNVVATCGTALTPDHLKLLGKFGSRVIMLFDSDKAGINATEKAMETGLEMGAVLHGASMPPDLDPDELLFDQQTGQPVADGRERMSRILADAQPLLDTRIASAVVEAKAGPEARAQALKQVAAWLARFNDPVGLEIRAEQVAAQLGVSRELLQRAMVQATGGRASAAGTAALIAVGRPIVSTASANAGPSRPVDGPSGPTPPPPGGAWPSGRPVAKARAPKEPELTAGEKILLGGLAQGGEFIGLLTSARSKLPPDQALADLFDYVPARELIAQIEAVSPDFKQVPLESPDSQVRSTLTEAAVMTDSGLTLGDFKVAIARALEHCWARFSQQIKTALDDAEAKKDAELHARLLKDYLDVRRKMKEFTSFYDEA